MRNILQSLNNAEYKEFEVLRKECTKLRDELEEFSLMMAALHNMTHQLSQFEVTYHQDVIAEQNAGYFVEELKKAFKDIKLRYSKVKRKKISGKDLMKKIETHMGSIEKAVIKFEKGIKHIPKES